MTRTNVIVGDSEVLDAFHDHDDDAVEVTVGDATTTSYSDEAGTIRLDGFEADLEEYDEKYNGVEYRRTFEVRLNDELVAKGLLNERTNAAVSVEAGNAAVMVPPNYHVEIDIYGAEALDG